MKQKVIKIGVLSVVFIAAVILFSILTNRGNTDVIVAMGNATLPTISFETEGYAVNTLVGYRQEMSIPAMRDTITPLDAEGNVKVNIQAYENKVEKMTYQVCTLNGETVLFEKTETVSEPTLVLTPGSVLPADVEAVLKITLITNKDEKIHYYTRIVNPVDFQTKECLDFTQKLHTHIMSKETNEIQNYLEVNGEADAGTLQHVTIHSDVEQVTWGQLKPEIVGDIQWDIKETNETYTSVLLRYQVACMDEDEGEDVYDVQEFFKVRKLGQKYYLLVYERNMEEELNASNMLVSKGVNLGITFEDLQYKTAKEGSLVAFVRDRELWCYDKEEDSLSVVFSFGKAEKEDPRHDYDQHNIHIVSMEKNGDMMFMVYGYMNRGNHEGQVGVAFYQYNHAYETLTEKVFIKSDKSFAVAAEELCKMVYVEGDTLYIVADENLVRRTILPEEDGTEILAEGLTAGTYVRSEDGRRLAYLKENKIEVLDMSTGKAQEILPAEGENIWPLGFVDDDVVYGMSLGEDRGKTVSGADIEPMYKLEIRDSKNQVVKVYEEDGIYISDIFVEGNMITLKRVKANGSKYKEVAEDYITNHEERVENNIFQEAYTTPVKKRQYRLAFEDRIEDINPKILRAKQLLVKEPVTIERDHAEETNAFYVYGAGKMIGVYDRAGYAVQEADEKEGVVVSSNQTYVWERGNYEAWYQISNMRGQKKKSGESALDACLRIILEYEGSQTTEFSDLTPLEVLNQYSGGEGLDLTGCKTENLCYIVGKGTPVIAMTGSEDGVLLIGYYTNTIVYLDPDDGKIKTHTFKKMDDMTAATGNTFLGYAKQQTYE